MGKNKKLCLSRRLRYSAGNTSKKPSFLFLFIAVVMAFGVFAFKQGGGNQATASVLGASTEVLTSKYVVKKGDTIFRLADDYKVEWKEIARINSLHPPYSLEAGQELIIEKPR